VKRSGGSLQNLVTMTIFINDLRYGDQAVKMRDQMFPDGKFPASAVRIRRKVDSDREENGKKSF
jgi:2-iminobutanoate/2-iminopropanoate deaminase